MLASDIASKAYAHWINGEILEAGKLLFECLPNESRPKWAADILRLTIERTEVKSDAIMHILSVAAKPEDWGKAHKAFDDLREATLKLERQKSRSPNQDLLLSHLLLAELVAKVTYNSTQPPDEFDEDSGWWIAICLKDILNRVDDEEFSNKMWCALSAHAFESPISLP
jgi:hypothetical protein